MSTNVKPIARINQSPITASIWHNEQDGRSFYSVSFQRSFKTETGEWQYSHSFGPRDLLLLAKVADQSHSEICRLRAAEPDAQESDQ
jgi:hypothetical protein